jgi:hypothetical protein
MDRSVEWWLENWKRIGKYEEYSEKEMKIYLNFIKNAEEAL